MRIDDRQVGALEIEITPAMIEAAFAEFARFNSDYATEREGAEAILRAALVAGEYITEN